MARAAIWQYHTTAGSGSHGGAGNHTGNWGNPQQGAGASGEVAGDCGSVPSKVLAGRHVAAPLCWSSVRGGPGSPYPGGEDGCRPRVREVGPWGTLGTGPAEGVEISQLGLRVSSAAESTATSGLRARRPEGWRVVVAPRWDSLSRVPSPGTGGGEATGLPLQTPTGALLAEALPLQRDGRGSPPGCRGQWSGPGGRRVRWRALQQRGSRARGPGAQGRRPAQGGEARSSASADADWDHRRSPQGVLGQSGDPGHQGT